MHDQEFCPGESGRCQKLQLCSGEGVSPSLGQALQAPSVWRMLNSRGFWTESELLTTRPILLGRDMRHVKGAAA